MSTKQGEVNRIENAEADVVKTWQNQPKTQNQSVTQLPM